MCWGINISALVVGVFYLRRPEPRWAVAVGTAMVLLTALDTMALILPTLSRLDPTMYALAATFYGLLAPVVQLPFRHTAAIAVVVTSAGVLGTLLAAEGSDTTRESLVLAVILTLISTLLIGPAMSFANERDLRARFLGEKTIARQRTLIRRYAPSSVVSRIELGDTTVDQPQRRKVTVFFSDVVGFTALADRVDPEALADIVNDYLGELSELIERHGGTLNEFAGDGVMAIFGAPDELASVSTAAPSQWAPSVPRFAPPTPASGCRPISRRGCRPKHPPAGSCSPTRAGIWSRHHCVRASRGSDGQGRALPDRALLTALGSRSNEAGLRRRAAGFEEPPPTSALVGATFRVVASAGFEPA